MVGGQGVPEGELAEVGDHPPGVALVAVGPQVDGGLHLVPRPVCQTELDEPLDPRAGQRLVQAGRGHRPAEGEGADEQCHGVVVGRGDAQGGERLLPVQGHRRDRTEGHAHAVDGVVEVLQVRAQGGHQVRNGPGIRHGRHPMAVPTAWVQR